MMILDFSKLETGKMRLEESPFNLSDLVEAVLENYTNESNKKRLALGCYIPQSVQGNYLGDIVRLKQVLMNLVGNAIKFTEQGEVHIEVFSDEIAGKSRIRFIVTDTGIGIPDSERENIFRSFTQVDASTTRLLVDTAELDLG